MNPSLFPASCSGCWGAGDPSFPYKYPYTQPPCLRQLFSFVTWLIVVTSNKKQKISLIMEIQRPCPMFLGREGVVNLGSRRSCPPACPGWGDELEKPWNAAGSSVVVQPSREFIQPCGWCVHVDSPALVKDAHAFWWHLFSSAKAFPGRVKTQGASHCSFQSSVASRLCPCCGTASVLVVPGLIPSLSLAISMAVYSS